LEKSFLKIYSDGSLLRERRASDAERPRNSKNCCYKKQPATAKSEVCCVWNHQNKAFSWNSQKGSQMEIKSKRERQINFVLNFRSLLISNAPCPTTSLSRPSLMPQLTLLAAGIGWATKKVVKENFTSDPSSSVMNYAKFTAVMAGSIALKKFLEDQKILPTSV